MSIKVTDYCDARQRASQLGCRIPERLALLPRNFEDAKSKEELVHESSTATVRKLLRQAIIQETPLESEGERFPTFDEKSLDWIGPVILVTTAALSQNPEIMTVALNVISNYLTDFFKGMSGHQKVRVQIVVEKEGQRVFKKISYQDGPEGLSDLAKVVKEVASNE